MIIGSKIFEQVNELGVTFKPKDSCWYLSLIGSVLAAFGSTDFRAGTWVAIGDTVYYPNKVTDPFDIVYVSIVTHELTHIRRQRGRLLRWLFKYFFLPVPAFFAYCRWVEERVAIVAALEYKLGAGLLVREDLLFVIELKIHTLWRQYGFVWPRSWMRQWFHKQFNLEVRDD